MLVSAVWFRFLTDWMLRFYQLWYRHLAHECSLVRSVTHRGEDVAPRKATWPTGALGKHQLLLALLRLRQQHITHRCCVLFSFSYKSFAVQAFILQCAFKPTETCKSAVAFIVLCCLVWLGVPVRKMLSQVPQSSNVWRSLLIPDVTTTAA